MRRSLALALVLVIAACPSSPRGGDLRLEVYAAASLTEAFEDLAGAFERANPGAEVALTFAGSQVLRLQIEQGAGADVFASANPEHVEALIAAGRVQDARLFAHNEMVVIVPMDNPAHIRSFADLPRAERLVIGTANVPAGRYAREAFRRGGASLGPDFEAAVLASVVSEETNVRLARAKVELGEADAAVVYATDAIGSAGVRLIEMPDDVRVRADYLIGVVQPSDVTELAERWVALVTSAEGREALARRGFVLP